MKLATIAYNGTTNAVVMRDEGAIPVSDYPDVGALLAAGERGLTAAAEAERCGEPQPLADRRLCGPVLHPGAVFCVGLNYRSHILEMGRELPSSPTLFGKLERSLTDPETDIQLPDASEKVDYEGELVVVIGRAGRDIARDQAAEHIAGYTLMNDVSMRDWQNRTIQWFAGKNFARSTPIGPWLVTADELDLDRKLTTSVNGAVRQQAPLSDLVFDPASLVADISRMTTLEPGDLIATGTPGGVGHAIKPPVYLRHGDVVEVAVPGIGTLRNRFVQ
jgi:acylpyruvate hydrolase